MFTAQEQIQLASVANNWKLTPATLAHKLSEGSWIPARHLRYISAVIARAIALGGGRIIISLPPRHGKSELASYWTPVWTLENYPTKQIILASYGADLSVGFGRRVRDAFVDVDYQNFLATKLNPNSKRVQMFHTTEGGYMASVGVGGPITGRGAHVLLIDDYIKEVKEALSPTYREYIWNWFVTTAFTRLEPGGTCIIIATRWHTDDLIGRILANYPDRWKYIEIPAEAELDDPLGRALGEPLFPERYDKAALDERKETLGSVWYQALFQQKPVDETKKLASSTWLKKIPDMPLVGLRMIRVWDLAATEGGGDYTTGTKMGWDKMSDLVYIPDIKRAQVSPQNGELLVRRTAEADGRNVIIGIEVEPGASGKHLYEHFRNNVLQGFIVKPIKVANKGSKTVRAQPFLAACEAGKVFQVVGDMKKPHAWVGPFDKELDTFPGGLNDDQVDTAAEAYTELTGRKVFSVSWGRTPNPNNDNSSSKALRRAQFAMARPTTSAERDQYGKVIPSGPHVTSPAFGVTWGRKSS